MRETHPSEEETRRTLWRRRVFLVLLPLAVAAALLTGIIVADDDDDGGGEGTPATLEEAPLPETRGAARGAGGSIRIERPVGWREVETERGVRLRTRDRSAQVAVLAVAGAGQRQEVLADTLEAAREGYESFNRIRRPDEDEGPPAQISDRPALTRAFEATTPDGEQVRGLLSTVSADGSTYLVQVVTAVNAPPDRIVEAQLAVSSIELG